MVRNVPNILNPAQIKKLLMALEHLFEYTNFSMKNDRNIYDCEYDEETNKESAQCSKKCSRLAYSLYMKSMKENKVVPEIIKKWKDESICHPLPEIRKIWENHI